MTKKTIIWYISAYYYYHIAARWYLILKSLRTNEKSGWIYFLCGYFKWKMPMPTIYTDAVQYNIVWSMETKTDSLMKYILTWVQPSIVYNILWYCSKYNRLVLIVVPFNASTIPTNATWNREWNKSHLFFL